MKQLVFIAMLTMIFNAVAQKDSCKVSVVFTVLDYHNKFPLTSVHCFIDGKKFEVESDENGTIRFEQNCVSKVDYSFGLNGYSTEKIALSVFKRDTSIVVYLDDHSSSLTEFSISVKRKEQAVFQTLQRVDSSKILESRSLSLGDVLKNIPGVSSLNTGNSVVKPVLHGLHSNRLLLVQHDLRQEGQQWGVEHAPEIDPFTAGDFQVISGAASVRYGSDAIAGVVLIQPKKLRDSSGFNGEINLIGTSNGRGGTSSAFLDFRPKKWNSLAFRLQGTLKKNGNLRAPDYYLVNTGQEESNYSATAEYKKDKFSVQVYYSQFNTKLAIFSASHIGNLTDLKKAFNSEIPLETGGFSYDINRPYQGIFHELLKVKLDWKLNRHSDLSLVYGRQYNKRFEYDKHRPLNDSLAALNKPELEFRLTSHSVDLIHDLKLKRKVHLQSGVNLAYQGNTYSGRPLIPNFRQITVGVFSILQYKSKRYNYELGVRQDVRSLEVFKFQLDANGNNTLITPQYFYSNLSFNVGVMREWKSGIQAKLNVGKSWRSPSIAEMYSSGLHHGAAAIEYGDPNLKKETSYQLNAQFSYSGNQRWKVIVGPYLNIMDGFIYREPTKEPILTIRGAYPGFKFVQKDVVLYGVDVDLNYSINAHWYGSLKGALVRANERESGLFVIGMPADRATIELGYLQERLNNRIKKVKGYVAFSAVNKQWRVPSGMDFALPPTGYVLVQMGLSAQVMINNQPLQLGITVLNAFNKAYRDYLDRFRYFADAAGRNVQVRIGIPLGK